MHYLLDRFSCIPLAARRQLAGAGVEDTDALLCRATTPKDRKRLAQQVGVSEDDLERWTGLADLVRVKGVGPAYASMFVHSGVVGNIQQLIDQTIGAEGSKAAQQRPSQQPDIRRRAADLAEKLRAWAAETPASFRTPSPRALAEMAEEALELRPRLILRHPTPGKAFATEMREEARKDQRLKIRFALKLLAMIGGALFVLFPAFYLLLRFMIAERVHEQFQEAVLKALAGMTVSLGILAVLMLVAMVLVVMVYDGLSYVLKTQVTPRLLNSPADWTLYRDRKMDPVGKRKLLRYGVIVMIVLMGLLTVFSIVDFERITAQRDELIPVLLPLFTALAVIGMGLVAVPQVGFFLRAYRSDTIYDGESVQRYALSNLFDVAWGFGVILGMIYLALPAVLHVHQRVVTSYVVPHYEREIEEEIAALEGVSVPWAEDDEETWTIESLQPHQTRYTALLKDGVVITLADDVEAALRAAMPLAFWMLIAGVTLLFVFPYVLFRGWRRSAFFAGLLMISFLLEGVLSEKTVGWFRLTENSTGAVLMIALVVFSTALLSDSIMEVFGEPARVCPGCRHRVEPDDAYCSLCGMQQA